MRFHFSVAEIISSPLKLKVAVFLLTHEAPMSEREIASVLKISHMSVNRVMAELMEINCVAFKAIGKAHVWTVNRKSYAFLVLKKLFDAMNAQSSPLEALKGVVGKHLSKAGVVKAVLFGSLAKGLEQVDSDIDLLIVVRAEKDKDRLESDLEKLSTVCLDMFGNRLAPYILSKKELKAKQSLAVVQEAEKGMVLYESKV